jgi:ribosomal protein S18 acetylase RimI-like enzyme
MSLELNQGINNNKVFGRKGDSLEIRTIEFEEMDPIINRILNADQEAKIGLITDENRKLAFALVENGEIVGGITGKMNYNRCHVSGLGIEKEFRSSGYGALLMKEIEEAAIEIGAKIITVSTQDFQALSFYEKLGYRVFGKLEDCPFEGTTKYYMSKRVVIT